MITLALISLVLLGSATAAMLARSVIHSALWLVATWLGVAAFYLWAGAEFAAFAQVLVYVGAISMVVLFAVLLTRATEPKASGEQADPSIGRMGAAICAAVMVGAVVMLAIAGTPLPERKAAAAPALNVRTIGEELAGPEAAALLTAGLLLTAALIGAVAIASSERVDKRGGPS